MNSKILYAKQLCGESRNQLNLEMLLSVLYKKTDKNIQDISHNSRLKNAYIVARENAYIVAREKKKKLFEKIK